MTLNIDKQVKIRNQLEKDQEGYISKQRVREAINKIAYEGIGENEKNMLNTYDLLKELRLK